MKSKKKIIYTMIAAVLLLLLYIMIFGFSAEDGEASSVVSQRVLKFLARFYYSFRTPSQGIQAAVEEAAPMENLIRKLAHFTEYFGVGFLSYSIVVLWYTPVWRGRLLVVVQLFLSAAFDEIHQYFIPGRYSSVKDVLIDVCGGCIAIILISIWLVIRRRRNNRFPEEGQLP